MNTPQDGSIGGQSDNGQQHPHCLKHTLFSRCRGSVLSSLTDLALFANSCSSSPLPLRLSTSTVDTSPLLKGIRNGGDLGLRPPPLVGLTLRSDPFSPIPFPRAVAFVCWFTLESPRHSSKYFCELLALSTGHAQQSTFRCVSPQVVPDMA
ncbi:uncharacterized protein BJX67DRAFT_318083 [Aspergillus lucknowensis]|uniref:Uncharacterized protein n=1 Tax=Aspergillus lucknowensis TaxID=176173 RepID=A0ABR4L9T9_9EURO